MDSFPLEFGGTVISFDSGTKETAQKRKRAVEWMKERLWFAFIVWAFATILLLVAFGPIMENERVVNILLGQLGVVMGLVMACGLPIRSRLNWIAPIAIIISGALCLSKELPLLVSVVVGSVAVVGSIWLLCGREANSPKKVKQKITRGAKINESMHFSVW